MKNMRKFFALVLSIIMVMSLATTAFAQTVDSGDGKATITVTNPAKGETYTVVKLFAANVTGNDPVNGLPGSIFYTGTIPTALEAYFEVKTTIGEGDTAVDPYIVSTADELSKEAVDAMKAWAEKQDAVATAVSDGTELTFTDLDYGYYIVLSTQGAGAISVTSTNPNGTIVDKNKTEPKISKLVNGEEQDTITIGDTVTYTVDFTAPNYLGEGEDAELVYKYVIEDTLLKFLDEVTVVSVVIDQPKAADVTLTDTDLGETIATAFADKKITVQWATKADADAPYVSLYENGSIIKLTYTAVVVSEQDIIVDGTTGNVNTVTVKGYTDDDTPDEPWEKEWKDEASILTYAAAFRKVDGNDAPLTGAEFTVNGLTLKGDNGLYEVVTYDPTSTAAGTTIKTDDEGYVVIEGLDDDEVLSVIETKAPAGYNKLTAPIEVKPIVTGVEVESESHKVWYDEEGEVVDETHEGASAKYTVNTSDEVKGSANTYKIVNQAGTELPSTGGMGTTLFYVLGGLMVLGSAILLVTKKRMGAEG